MKMVLISLKLTCFLKVTDFFDSDIPQGRKVNQTSYQKDVQHYK